MNCCCLRMTIYYSKCTWNQQLKCFNAGSIKAKVCFKAIPSGVSLHFFPYSFLCSSIAGLLTSLLFFLTLKHQFFLVETLATGNIWSCFVVAPTARLLVIAQSPWQVCDCHALIDIHRFCNCIHCSWQMFSSQTIKAMFSQCQWLGCSWQMPPRKQLKCCFINLLMSVATMTVASCCKV